MKNVVTVVVQQGNRNFGFATVVKATASYIQKMLDETYGADNILVCTIKEI